MSTYNCRKHTRTNTLTVQGFLFRGPRCRKRSQSAVPSTHRFGGHSNCWNLTSSNGSSPTKGSDYSQMRQTGASSFPQFRAKVRQALILLTLTLTLTLTFMLLFAVSRIEGRNIPKVDFGW